MYICSYCSRSFDTQRGLSIHLKSCKNNPDKDEEYTAHYSKPRKCSKWSLERRKRHSLQMRALVKKYPDKFCGHYGRHTIAYNGALYDSSWEVLFQKYLDRNRISGKRNESNRFDYYFENSLRTYLPDFYLTKLQVYVEIKGFITDRDMYKWLMFPKDQKLFVLTRKSIDKITNNKCLHLVKLIKKYKKSKQNLFIDGSPVYSKEDIQIKRLLLSKQKRKKLTSKERSDRIKQGLATSERAKARHAKALLNNKIRNLNKDKRYVGKRNSQYGTFWITNGCINKKWKSEFGNFPKGFYKGRIC